MRRKFLVLSAVALLAVAGHTASGAATTGPSAPTPRFAAGAVPGLSTLGATGWKVLSSATAGQGGQQISTPGFDTAGWLPVTPDDAGAPGTEITALLQNGKCPNVFFADNMKTCFGTQKKIGPETVPQFMVPWWYRTDFTPGLQSGQTASLVVNGIVGQADVWVNGKEVATQATVTGAYTRFTFDVTSLMLTGTNSVALEVYPNDPAKMLTLDDVDWNQIPPDNNTGIQFPVQLDVASALGVGNAHVVPDTSADLSSSALTVKADVTNNSAASQTGSVTATVTPPSGAGPPIVVQQPVTVAAHATQTVSLTPGQNPGLTIAHPQIWWPYQLGAQPLYTLDTVIVQGGVATGSTHETFGIRTVTSALVGKSAGAPNGVRSFSVDGRPVVIRGGGFAEDLFLRYSSSGIARQIALMKNLGINLVRIEGHFFPDDFYQQMDAAGIMVDSGFQCCDAWENDSPSAADLAVRKLSSLTIAQHERNHPSVMSFSWSDNAPGAAEEAGTIDAFAQAGFAVPLIASAEYNSSPKLGASGEKEGPYDYVPPNYWYDTSHFDKSDSTLTNAGGSWGFDSEQSAGNTVPTQDSISRFLSASDQAALWQNPGFNQYHANYEAGHGGYKFGTLFVFDQALTSRYGTWSDLGGYVEEAQVQNYENTRAQFEAFVDHSTNAAAPSTGTVYWQVNKGWPTVLWDLYNYDGDQAGSFFGAKKANGTLHALYALDNNTVTLDNLGGTTQNGLTVESKVYDTAGTLLDDQQAAGLTLNSQQVRNAVLTPKVPAATTPPAAAKTYFVELLLRQGNAVVDRNVYWQSTQQDVVNWASTLGNPQASMTQYANLQALKSLPQSTVGAVASTRSQPGPDGADTVSTVTITNTSKTPAVGFFLRADVRRGNPDGTEQPGDNQVSSGLWDDNDVTLWPGESQTLNVTYRAADLHGATPVISLSGWNAAKVDVPAAGGAGAAPATPVDPTASATSGSTIEVGWTEPAGADPAVSYRVYEGATVVAASTTTSATVSGLAAGSTHAFTVTALDAAGHESPPSAPVTATTPGGGTVSVTITKTADTGSTYTDTATITNNSGSAVNGWNLQFDLVGRMTVTSATGATVTSNAHHWTLTSIASDAAIPVGASIAVRFGGGYTRGKGYQPPVNVTFTGQSALGGAPSASTPARTRFRPV
ncbi:cellulose binding domain-containing protein [Amycolatopsis mediterranei]|uniref:glycosyl hydrolase 2 galactose-binding domain-containing protein n=1 Tax=Amycolatopsis mediterranei TaxID=33910 RepID=UPI003417FD63